MPSGRTVTLPTEAMCNELVKQQNSTRTHVPRTSHNHIALAQGSGRRSCPASPRCLCLSLKPARKTSLQRSHKEKKTHEETCTRNAYSRRRASSTTHHNKALLPRWQRPHCTLGPDRPSQYPKPARPSPLQGRGHHDPLRASGLCPTALEPPE